MKEMNVIMKKILSLLSVLLVMAACSTDKNIDDVVMATNEGAMRLAVASQSAVTADDTVVIKIYKVEGEEQSLIRRYSSVNDVPEYLTLLAGNYVAKVQVGEKRAVSFDSKYYYGEKAFTVEKGIVTSVTVDCKIQSTTVCVNYDASVGEKFSEGFFTTVAIAESYDAGAIATGDVLSLKYTETKNGYFVMPEGHTSLYWHFEGTHPAEGAIVKEGLIENIKAAAKYTITLKYSQDAPGGLLIEATVDETIEEFDDMVNFSPDPTIMGDGFDMTEEQLSTTASRTYNVASLASISIMNVTIDGVEYDLLTNAPAGITVEKTDDLTYKVIVSEAFFALVSGGDQNLTFYVEDVDGGKATKEVPYLVQGVMPLSTSDYDLWFGTVSFKATVINTDATSVKVAYSSDNGASWTEVAATSNGDGTYTAAGSAFAAGKNYTYKLVLDSVETGKALAHTTAAGAQIPNGDMEGWSTENDIIVPYAAGATPFWLTGNEGAKMASAVLTQSSTDVRPGSTGTKSAYLKSQKASVMGIGKFAAGNLFTGTFGMSGLNGRVQFGRDFAFTAKPTSLSFWMKHNEGTIDESGSGAPADATGTDKLSVMVIITAWDAPHLVDTADTSTFLSPDKLPTADGVIGYGSLEKRESNTEWAEYTINITYRDDTAHLKPKKLVISFTPSGFGDYFAGSTSSWMYVDDIVFNY